MLNRIKKVLVVDDNADFRLLFKFMLEQFHVEIVIASDGQEAIEKLQQNQIDLIITDFRMPHVNGVEILDWCRSKEIYTPVIFTTADKALFPVEKIALGDCCATLLSKPVNFKIFRAAVEAADRFDHHEFCMHSSFKEEFAKVLRDDLDDSSSE